MSQQACQARACVNIKKLMAEEQKLGSNDSLVHMVHLHCLTM